MNGRLLVICGRRYAAVASLLVRPYLMRNDVETRVKSRPAFFVRRPIESNLVNSREHFFQVLVRLFSVGCRLRVQVDAHETAREQEGDHL